MYWRKCFDRDDRPFIIDLESANGTTVNDEQIPTSRYYELKSNDGKFPIISSSALHLLFQTPMNVIAGVQSA